MNLYCFAFAFGALLCFCLCFRRLPLLLLLTPSWVLRFCLKGVEVGGWPEGSGLARRVGGVVKLPLQTIKIIRDAHKLFMA